MFALKISDLDASSGTIPISWCVDHETLNFLSVKKVTDPQVVIVVAPEGSRYHITKEYRAVVPLQELMTYVEFRSAGSNKIWGFVSLREKKDACDRYLAKEKGEYSTTVLTQDGSDWSQPFTTAYNPDNSQLNSPSIHMDVPEECFAKEPPQWEKTWVNHFFRGKCVDQCEFRRRRLFAYSIQPLIVAGDMLVRSVLANVSLLIAARNMSIKPLVHPLSYSLKDAAEACGGGSYCIKHLPEDDRSGWSPDSVRETYSYIFRSFYLLPTMPIIAIPLLTLAAFHCWTALIVIGSLVAAALGIIGIVSAVMTGTAKSFWSKIQSKFISPDVEEEEPDLDYMKRTEIDLLVCNPERKPVTLESLPSNKKTLRLRFLNLKSKVCRPFSL